jgi:hypothetical protein
MVLGDVSVVQDMVSTLALVYTAGVTPVEIAFFPSDSPGWQMSEAEWVWFWINRAIDLIFVVDIILQFFVM